MSGSSEKGGTPVSPRALALSLAIIASVGSCTGSAPVGSISATTERHQLGGYVIIKGTSFPAGGKFRFEFRNVPGISGFYTQGYATADAQGKFEATTSFNCTTRDRETDWPNVLISAVDVTGGASEFPVTTVGPGIWVCR